MPRSKCQRHSRCPHEPRRPGAPPLGPAFQRARSAHLPKNITVSFSTCACLKTICTATIKERLMKTLATWSVRHRRLVVLLWLALLLGATLAARTAGSDYSNQLSLPGTPSTQAVS